VAVDESSMVPALEPGDWLLVDPTVRRWPRTGSIVVFREPGSDLLVVKRVAARAPAQVDTEFGRLALELGEAWLLGDAAGSHDSRHYGPVGVDRLVARAWLRYGPPGRIGLLRPRSRAGR
jgi:signal peptidase I